MTKPRGYTIQGIQPIFRGFRTYNAVNNAEATVRAERENLRDIERQVLLQAVTAYMDVVRDQELVRLNENNVNVLSRELKAAQDRFAVGEVTRTDVAQAEARRADSVSRLDAARANLRTSRGSFQQVVGHPPEGLSWPAPPEQDIPKSLQDATASATTRTRWSWPRSTASRRRSTSSTRSAASCCRACSSRRAIRTGSSPQWTVTSSRRGS